MVDFQVARMTTVNSGPVSPHLIITYQYWRDTKAPHRMQRNPEIIEKQNKRKRIWDLISGWNVKKIPMFLVLELSQQKICINQY